MEKILEVKNLSVSFDSPKGEVQAVRDVSFSLKKGEVLAIVGESGCGKSVLCKSIMKLLPKSARIKGGSILVNGADITGYKERDMAKIRGKVFSMIFSGSYDVFKPNYKNRRADCRGNFNSPQEKNKRSGLQKSNRADGTGRN